MKEEVILTLRELLLSEQPLKEILEDYHNSDIADALEQLSTDDRLRIYSILDLEQVADIFSYYENVEDYVAELDVEYAADILELMESSDAVDVLNELEEEEKEEIIQLMDEEAVEQIQQIDSYEEDQIGSYITDNYVVIKANSTIKSAMNQLIEQAGEHDNINVLYVVDENNKYVGAIFLKDLITARQNDSLSNLIMAAYPSFYDDEIMSECIEKITDYSETSIPVINHEYEIIGVLTTDSLIEATTDEFEEDYAKLGGLTEEEEFDEPVFTSIKKRIPWLIVLLFLGLIVSSVIGIFESVIVSVPIIVFFQSMILGMAGNVGTQSLAVTIRNISNEDIAEDKKKQTRSILKELRIGLCNGLLIGAISFVFVFLYLLITKTEVYPGQEFSITPCLVVSGIIAVSMLVSIALASVIGTCFPLLLTKLHIDPAVASGPFITTLNDIIAVLVYYGLTFLLFIVLM